MNERDGAQLFAALAAVWTRIRELHPEVPAVMVLAAPSSDRRMRVLGHFAPLRWKPRSSPGEVVHEVVVVAEHLDRSVDDIIETLIHEAAHAMNFSRGIKDCSRSQYHNAKFKDAAEELGLIVARVPNYGFAYTVLGNGTIEQYAAERDALESVLLHRRKPQMRLVPVGGVGGPKTTDAGDDAMPRNRLIKAVCTCEPPNIIRASRKVYAATVIGCSSCKEPFSPQL